MQQINANESNQNEGGFSTQDKSLVIIQSNHLPSQPFVQPKERKAAKRAALKIQESFEHDEFLRFIEGQDDLLRSGGSSRKVSRNSLTGSQVPCTSNQTSAKDPAVRLAGAFSRIQQLYEEAQLALKEENKEGETSSRVLTAELADRLVTLWSTKVVKICVESLPTVKDQQSVLVEALKDVNRSQAASLKQPVVLCKEPQEVSEVKQSKVVASVDMLSQLQEMVMQFQARVLVYENDLESKVEESHKLIREFENHVELNQVQMQKFQQNCNLSKTIFAGDQAVLQATSQAQIESLERSLSSMRAQFSIHKHQLQQLSQRKADFLKASKNFFHAKGSQICNEQQFVAENQSAGVSTTAVVAAEHGLDWPATFTPHYGLPSSSLEAKKSVTWPTVAFFRNRTKHFMYVLRLKKIEWHEAIDGSIDALKVTLSDGAMSPRVGLSSVQLNNSVTFDPENPIRSIEVLSSASQGKIFGMCFLDQEKSQVALLGQNVPKRISSAKATQNSDVTKTLHKLRKNEYLLGFQAVERKPNLPSKNNDVASTITPVPNSLAGLRFLVITIKE